jgi:SNF2 family DNA or RNA helicase
MKPLTSATAALLKPIALHETDRMTIRLDGNYFICEIHAVTAHDPTKWTWASYPARSHFPVRVPERKVLTGGKSDTWQFGATDITVTVINALWKPEQLEFIGEDAQLQYDYLIASSIAYARISEMSATYHADKSVPAHQMSSHADFPLTPYQRVATAASLLTPGYALFMEQGTGKTPCVISHINTEASKCNGRMHRSLIVCPKQVRTNWVEELEKFSTVHGRATILRGDNVDRIKLLIDALTPMNGDKYTAVICSYEVMTRMQEALMTLEWDLITLDEGHSIKAPNSKRTRASHVLREHSTKKLLLTGSPIGNTMLDLYSQLEFLGKGASGFTTWKAFKNFYGVYIKDESTGGYEKLIGIQNLPFMKERLARYSFIIKKKDALPDLPDKLYRVLECSMGAKQTDAYNSLSTSLMAEIDQDLLRDDAPPSVVINNVLTKLLRLAQVTSGFIPLDPYYGDNGEVIQKRRIKHFTPNPKLDTLVEALKEKDPNSKSVIWCHWIPDILTIRERLEAEGRNVVSFYGGTSEADRAEAIRRFNCDPNCKVFISNPAAGGSGLNLLGYPPGKPEGYDTNCDEHFVYSQSWSYLTRSQAEDRSHRKGTRVPVQITDLCVPKTIDEEIRVRVLKKKKDALEISDIRDILKAVLHGVARDDE